MANLNDDYTIIETPNVLYHQKLPGTMFFLAANYKHLWMYGHPKYICTDSAR